MLNGPNLETGGVEGAFRTRDGPTIQRAAYFTPLMTVNVCSAASRKSGVRMVTLNTDLEAAP